MAIRALQYAMTVCDGIRIIKVQLKTEVPIVLLRIAQEELDNMQLEHGRLQLVPARELLADAGRSYREHVVIGDPAAKIVEVAKAEGVDAIIMGTRGMRALGNLALGSTATKVIHWPKCRSRSSSSGRQPV